MDKLGTMMTLYNDYLNKSQELFSIDLIKFTEENIDRKIEILEECLETRIFISEHPEYHILYDMEPDTLW